MVKFVSTPDGYEVLVDGQRFGYITKWRGFFTGPITIIVPLTVSSSELIEIAKKIEEIIAQDKTPDRVCRTCGGTPNFTKQIPKSRSDGMRYRTCPHQIHQYRVK